MKLSTAIVQTPSVRYEVQHGLAVLLYAFFGAVVGYLQAEPATAITAAITHWESAKPMLIGAVVAGVVATLGQAQKSFFTAFGILALASTAMACTPAARAPVENDVTKIAACVEDQIVNQHATDVITVVAACGSNVPTLVMDIIRAIFDAPKLGVPAPQLERLHKSYLAHPELLAPAS
jgi:hypothetical protein